jgi:hypothetical protein
MVNPGWKILLRASFLIEICKFSCAHQMPGGMNYGVITITYNVHLYLIDMHELMAKWPDEFCKVLQYYI